MNSFNLLDEPWIRVSMLDGSTEELSLRQVFSQGEDILQIRGDGPTQDVALMRLLIAIAHRTLEGPEDLDGWMEAWEDLPDFSARVVKYLERYRSRFDLRDERAPFFQVAGIHSGSGKSSDISAFLIDVPNGAPFFAMRRGKRLERLSWAEAARWLVHVHAYDPSGIRTGAVGDASVKGGKVYPIGPGWTGQIGAVLVEDANLLRSILRNTVPLTESRSSLSVDRDLDLPPWELEPDPVGAAPGRSLAGPVTCCTWQTRRVLLHGDDEGVTSLFLGNGDRATPQNRHTVESMSAWRYSAPQSKKAGSIVYMPYEHDISRSFWRSLNSVLPALAGRRKIEIKEKGRKDSVYVSAALAPAVVEFQSDLHLSGIVPSKGLLPLHAVGVTYGSNQSVVSEVVESRLEIPAALLDPANKELATLVADSIEQSERAAYAVYGLAVNLVIACGGTEKTQKDAGAHATRDFYIRIDAQFPRWLRTLARSDCDVRKARLEWQEVLRREAYELSHELIEAAPPTAVVGRENGSSHMDLGLADVFFRAALAKFVPRETDADHDRETVSVAALSASDDLTDA